MKLSKLVLMLMLSLGVTLNAQMNGVGQWSSDDTPVDAEEPPSADHPLETVPEQTEKVINITPEEPQEEEPLEFPQPPTPVEPRPMAVEPMAMDMVTTQTLVSEKAPSKAISEMTLDERYMRHENKINKLRAKTHKMRRELYDLKTAFAVLKQQIDDVMIMKESK